MAGYDANKQTGIDMLTARNATSFNTQNIRNYIWNGQDEWNAHSDLVQILSNDPTCSKASRPFLDRNKRFLNGLAVAKHLGELQDKHRWSDGQLARALALCEVNNFQTLHSIAFSPPLLSQGGSELTSEFGSLAKHRGILGAYAQTELGHGTNVASVETTATYLPNSQEFELDSPTLTSAKWWIGGSGRVATHAVVQARLILPSGKDCGPHLFFVQLRSLENHLVCEGLEIGDIGPKAFGAVAANDNGFIRFRKVRIPRYHMLNKFANVTEAGDYVVPPHNKLSYGGMLFIRSGMVTSAGWQLAKAITIAIRYATVRRQGGGSNGFETQVIRYPSVYYRLLPILSRAYVFILLGRDITTVFENMSSRLAGGDTSLLSETHAILSALKVLVSTSSVESLEVARRSMGGHGFSAFAGVGAIYAEQVPSTTYEGDNFVLDQQVVRSALKALQRFQSNGDVKLLSPSSHYLRFLTLDSHLPPSWSNHEKSILLLERRAALVVRAHASRDVLKDCNGAQRVSRAVGDAFVAARIRDMLSAVGHRCNGRDRVVVENLLLLYLLVTVEGALVDLLSLSVIETPRKNNPTADLRSEIAKVSAELVPDAIGLTDAFGFTDWELDSALGVADGKVYEELWRRAQLEPLNKERVVPGYEEFIKPILQRGQRLAGMSKL